MLDYEFPSEVYFYQYFFVKQFNPSHSVPKP